MLLTDLLKFLSAANMMFIHEMKLVLEDNGDACLKFDMSKLSSSAEAMYLLFNLVECHYIHADRALVPC